MQYYVNINAAAGGDGSKENPFVHIQDAANIAKPGDEVLVYPGIYREAVSPVHAGTEENPIVYRSIEPRKAVITGAEKLGDWKNVQGSVWTARVKNDIFPDRNPYTTLVSGDWFIATFIAHLGDVYLNGKSLYEVTEKEAVFNPKPSQASWDPDFSKYVWYAEQEGDETVFYANFHEFTPNKENVEFSVRKNCFYPEAEGVNYITLSGFTVCQAATQWAPPTAYQEGMVGPHWSKGWVIEDCEIFESKCSGISLGKYYQPENDNKWLKKKFKDGTQTEREVICRAQREGWTKERIGHHTVRRCDIHDCGQTGIVGHLGCVFSLIEDNHIHHINNKQNLAGAEIGGIKLHAAIDTIIRRNHFHHCTRGLWLDWQAQGTRVTQNLFHDNCLPFDYLMNPQAMMATGEDIFVEISHGPTLIDNNLLLSYRALKLPTQGVAVVHNFLAGSIACVGRGVNNGAKTLPSPRYTPYHVPHRTEIEGFMTVLHGDMRFYNNVFVQQKVPQMLKMASLGGKLMQNEWEDMNITCGLQPYDAYPTKAEWLKQFEGYCGMGSPASDRYYSYLPVETGGNVYANGAKPRKGEADAIKLTAPIEWKLTESNGTWTFETNLYEKLGTTHCSMITTETLGQAIMPEECFENPDGSPITFDTDLAGEKRDANVLPGPFANRSGKEIWKTASSDR